MSLKVDQVQLQIILKSDTTRAEIIKLEDQATQLEKEWKKLKKSGDDALAMDKKTELDATRKKIDDLRNSIDLNGRSMRELQQQAKGLQMQLNNLTPGSEKWQATQKELNAVRNRIIELKTSSKDTKNEFEKMLDKGVGGFINSSFSWVAAGAATVISAFNSLTDDALKAEKSMQRLSFAVKTVGGGSDSDVEKLKRQAESLMGIFGHEEIEGAATKMLNFGLKTNQVLKIMPLLVDAAAASGHNVDDLATAIDRGVSSGVKARSALGQLGITFKDTGSKAENFRLIQEGLTKFTGGNTAAMESQWGTVERLKIRWEEIKETMGDMLLKVTIPTVDAMSKIITINKSTAETYEDQVKKVADLTTVINPLLTRYDELKGKTKLSKEEQIELNTIIKQVGASIPNAVTQFDKYGNAIQISGTKAHKFVEDQIILMKYLNKQQIEEETEKQKKLQEEFANQKKAMDLLNKTGKLEVYVKGSQTNNYATDEEITAFRKMYAILESDLAGSKARIKQLNGDALKDELAEREKTAKEELNLNDESADKATAQKKRVDDKMKELETQNFKDLVAIKTRYVNGDIKTEFDYNQAILKQTKDFDDKKKAAYLELLKVSTDPSLRVEIRNKMAEIDKQDIDAKVKHLNDIKKILSDADPIQAEKDAYANRLRELGLFNVKEENMTKEELASLRLLQAEHELKLKEIYKKQDDVKIKSIQDSQKSIQDAVGIYENAERERLQGLLADGTYTQTQYNEEILSLEEQVSEARLYNATIYAELIRNVTFNTEEDKNQAIEAANTAIIAADKIYQQAKGKRTTGELNDEKARLNEISRIRQTLGLDQEKLGYMQSLKAFKQHLNDEKIAAKDQAEYINAFKLKKAQDYAQLAVQITNGIANAVQGYQQIETNNLETEKNKQLALAGDNATARTAIEHDFAQKELDLKKKQASANVGIQIAQALAAGALGVANIWAINGVNPILAGILTALEVATVGIQVGTIISQNSAIQNMSLDSSSTTPQTATSTGARVVNQAADGRYNVVGAKDGKRYNGVRYAGRATTGMVTTPTLMGEAGTELVIDAPTLSRLNLKAPSFIPWVLANRVQQRADGKYDSVQNQTAVPGADNSAVMAALIQVMGKNNQLLDYLIANGVDAFVLLSQFEKAQALQTKSVSKGSLKG